MLDPPKEKTRTSPYFLGFLRQINQQIKVNFSDDNWEFSNESFIEDNPFFRFSYQVSYAAATQQLTLTYGYQSKVEHVTAVQYPDYLEALEKTQNYLSYSIFKYYPNQIANNDNLDWLLKLITPTSVILLIAGLYLLIFILWRIERRNKPEDSEVLFFPVSMPKLVAMWLLTFGFYGIYWFYKNFQFIKKQKNNSSMPWARGLFSSLWYYSLWRKLKTDNDQRFDSSHLPNKWLSILLAIAFFIVSALGDKDVFHVLSLLISALIIAPLANYILFVNKADSVSLKQHSKWSVRHYLLAVISIPLLVLQSSSAIGLIPSDTVVKGSWLLDHDIKFMQRQGVIKPGDSIDYFYSDAFLFVSGDGNGFTQRHVFSYWKEDQQPLYKELANYEDIQDIQVSWSKELADHSTVTIVRSDGSRFVLYVSNSDRKDKKFVAALKKNWQNYN